MKLLTTHTKKSPLGNVFATRLNEDMVCKIVVSKEEPCNPPTICNPAFVRIKQRRVFRDVREGKVVWSYELSKTWSASSRECVERAQHTCEPVYEVECEFVNESNIYSDKHNVNHLADSLLLKSNMLLGWEGMDGIVLKSNSPKRKRNRREN